MSESKSKEERAKSDVLSPGRTPVTSMSGPSYSKATAVPGKPITRNNEEALAASLADINTTLFAATESSASQEELDELFQDMNQNPVSL